MKILGIILAIAFLSTNTASSQNCKKFLGKTKNTNFELSTKPIALWQTLHKTLTLRLVLMNGEKEPYVVIQSVFSGKNVGFHLPLNKSSKLVFYFNTLTKYEFKFTQPQDVVVQGYQLIISEQRVKLTNELLYMLKTKKLTKVEFTTYRGAKHKGHYVYNNLVERKQLKIQKRAICFDKNL